MSKTKRISIIALHIALAFVLSYLETLIPLNFGIPGIKIGLANIVVVSALYTLPRRDAFFISMVRILISGLVFSGAFSLLYSFAGGVISFAAMAILSKNNSRFSIMGVSVLGGALHNTGQIIVAAIVMENDKIFYYLPVLLAVGAVCGAAVGAAGAIVTKRMIKIYKFKR